MVEVQGRDGFPRVCAPNRVLGETQPSQRGKLNRKVRLHGSSRESQPQNDTTYIRLGSPNVRSNSSLECPECGGSKLYKDGLRYLTDHSSIQRWLCRDCGYRFTDPSLKELQATLNRIRPYQRVEQIQTKNISNLTDRLYSRRMRAGARKNTMAALETETRAEISPRVIDRACMKGLITKFYAWLEKEGYIENTTYPELLTRLVKRGANLLDPEDVKAKIGELKVAKMRKGRKVEIDEETKAKNVTKMLFTYAYDAFCKMEKLQWEKPHYTQEEAIPFVPDEKELDMLIAGCHSRRMATFLQTLKETYADPGEILRLRWIDISGNIITINKPVKGHLPGQIEVKERLIAMLNALPRTSERIFPTHYQSMYSVFRKLRRRLALQYQNPRLEAIHFATFRHWGGTMIAHFTKGNLLTVKKLLRHKSITSTMKYVHMIQYEDSEFDVATATTVEEAKEMLKAGFDYIIEKSGIMLFRRPKRFGTLKGIG